MSPTPGRALWGRAALLALCFVALKLVSLRFVYPPFSSAMLWLPAGLTLAFLLRSPRRMWPVLLATIFLMDAGTEALRGKPMATGVAWGLGNVLRSLLAAVLMRRWVGTPVLFQRVRDVVVLVLVAFVGTLPSATLGALGAGWAGSPSFRAEWVGWWLSDSLGTVLVAPVLLSWWTGHRHPVRDPRRALELAGLLGLVALVSAFIFRIPHGATLDLFATLPYAAFPLVLTAALRHGARGAAGASAVMGIVAVEFTHQGRGLFGLLPVPVGEQVLSVQLFLAVLSVSALMLAAVVAARRRAEVAQRVLARAGAVLAESADWRTTLPEVTRLIVPELCAGSAIWLTNARGVVERVAAAGWNLEREAGLRGRFPPLPREPRYWRGPGGSGVLVPVRVRGRVVGALALVADMEGRPVVRRDVVLAEDLAHRCAMALEHTRLLDEAHEAIAVRDEFMTVAAHELRTPLATLTLRLQGLVGLLRREGVNGRAMEKLGIVSRQVTRLTELVESVLEVSRADAGPLELRRERVDLSGLVEEVVVRFMGEAARAGSELRLQGVAPELTGWLDRARVEQALLGLLVNAVKFGAGHPVDVELTRLDGRARLTVTDRGIGIAPEARERIFGRFERAVSPNQYGGLGLGLFLTRQIAEAHGGSVRVRSDAGAGATFTMELPVEPRTPLQEAPPQQPGA
ncbi:MAG TPA: MASE1 domain-containing protein [Myxococcus sp.]|nr:MASE1 domain-containing protein [Myxococcus sp.]